MYSVTSSTRGFITAICLGNPMGMVMCSFEWTNASTYPSLTQLALSGGSIGTYPQMNAPNTNSNGTQTIFLQIVGYTQIQVRTTVACTVNWYITFL